MITYHTTPIEGVPLFYREAGAPTAPPLVLLHGFPSSSHMFRELLRDLEPHFHLFAPDYPGFGNSAVPTPGDFLYTFDHLADVIEAWLATLGLERYSLYMQDYGGPVGFRLAVRHPEAITALIIQNASISLEGLSPAWAPLQEYWKDRQALEPSIRSFLTPETTRFQYLEGAGYPERISPDAYQSDQAFLDRPGNDAIQLDLLYNYQSNPERYPEWQAYLRQHQPRTLIVWGKRDPFFTEAGALAYQKDLPNAEIHLFESGHFLLEEYHTEVAQHIQTFLAPSHHEPA